MPTYEMTAYKWAGFTQYSDSVDFTVTDDDDQLDWYGQDTGSAEMVSIDGVGHSIQWSGTIETRFVDSDGQAHTEDIVYSYTSDGYFLIPQADSAFDEGSTIRCFAGGWSDTDGIDYEEVVCFTPDCRIDTPRGPVPVAALRPGDMLLTADNGPQPLRWIGRSDIPGLKRVAGDLHPILIRKDAFGPGRPARDIRVSPQHRFCLGDAALLFHDEEMLAPAKGLVDGSRVVVDRSARPVSYVHLLLDRHELLFCDGVQTESFQPSFRTMAMMDPRTRSDLAQAIGDRMAHYTAVRPALRPWEAPLLQRVS
ncbi:Hint domain-containing protein [Nioella ostreopsis]|uniref:Hint domain-containing protein n=1 Tax=Nioella ostreopsis TaxID=2448479 RepID=UPI000FDA9631|nr:Hint domain-containing protein [Nioella ostreopsis]